MEAEDPNPNTPRDQAPEPPTDQEAPTRHTLPSGKVVEIRSHRTMLGSDLVDVLVSQTDGGLRGVHDIYTALMARMATEVEPGRGYAPTLDGTFEAARAQRADDYNAMYPLLRPHFNLVNGTSVIPDLDQWADPKAPTADSSGSR